MTLEEKSFPATLKSLPALLIWVKGKISQTALSDSEKMRTELALEEAVVNVIEHAAKQQPMELTLSIHIDENQQIEFVLKDSGPPFNPLTAEIPKREDLSLQEIPQGGLGLPLMRKCMDALLYRREGDFNLLTLIKNLPVD